jgi:uncharacterized membrane protein
MPPARFLKLPAGQTKELNDMDGHVNVMNADRWASALGGAALAAWGLKEMRGERTPAGALIAAAGASLIVRGLQSPRFDTRDALSGARGVNVEHAFTINRRPDELYRFWRALDQLPRFMSHLVSVEELDPRRSRWTARGPAGRRVQWDAEIINEIPTELIGWRTLERSDVVSAGSVRFKAAPGGRGTEVHVRMQYEPPAGKAGAVIAWLFGADPASAIQEDLRRFKQLMESGEIPTIEGQPRGRRSILNYD